MRARAKLKIEVGGFSHPSSVCKTGSLVKNSAVNCLEIMRLAAVHSDAVGLRADFAVI